MAHAEEQRIGDDVQHMCTELDVAVRAVNTVIYMCKRVLSRAIGPSGGVPLTLMTMTALNASYFRVFSCTVFAKVPDRLAETASQARRECIPRVMVG
jgi:hypothetical protein